MVNKEILEFCLKNGLLLDKDILSLLSESRDFESVKIIIERIKKSTHTNFISKDVLNKNNEQINRIFCELPEESKKIFEELTIKLGLSIDIEISRRKSEIKEFNIIPSKQQIIINNFGKNFDNEKNDSVVGKDIFKEIGIIEEGFNNPGLKKDILKDHSINLSLEKVRVLPIIFPKSKKLEVRDFVDYFKNRFNDLRGILQEHSELNNLVSINKISNIRSNFSVVGVISDKKITKNKNILFEIEDFTGKTKVLINKDKKELYDKAEEIALDSVIGFKVSGNNEILFANEVIFPEAMLHERKKSFLDESAIFIGDLHFGSKRFLKEGFNRFIDYLNGKVSNSKEESEKIKYLFLVGDLVTGVGNYPNQERDLEIGDLESQFNSLAELLGKIRKDIILIISPGNHDGVRLMEPQPPLDEKFAWPLYDLKNSILTTNPAEVNIGSFKKGEESFSGFNVLTYHGFSFSYYANTISKLMMERVMDTPEKIMAYLLKHRHLAPTHSSIQYFPLNRDLHLIRNIPDILVSAHTHKSAVAYYNNILTISTSSWEGKTPYQEKFGNNPDHCKVPLFNLKTRSIKILDFEDKNDEIEVK